MGITGLRTTKNINQDRRIVDMSKRIALLQPSASPITVLTKRAKTQVTTNPIYNWLEDDLQGKWSQAINAPGTPAKYLASATAIGVADIGLFNTGDIVKVPSTGEIMRVTKVDAAEGEITVARGYGTTEAADIIDEAQLVILGSAFKEGDVAPEAHSMVTSTIFNYTQIMRKSVKVTKTQEASALYGGSDRSYQRMKKGIEHAIDIERACLFGEKSEHTEGGNVVRTTAGILALMGSDSINYSISSGGLTEDNFERMWLENLFQYGSDKKTLFASSRLISIINSWGRHKLETVVNEETYGLAITRYVSAHGTLNIVKHPLLEGDVYGKMGIALDLANINWRPLKGRDTKLKTNIQPNDADYYLDEYITEGGFQLKLPQTHGIISNVDFPTEV